MLYFYERFFFFIGVSAVPCLRGLNKKTGGIKIIGGIKIAGEIKIIDGAKIIEKTKKIIINSLILN